VTSTVKSPQFRMKRLPDLTTQELHTENAERTAATAPAEARNVVPAKSGIQN
jgi:hypothetical protein